MIEESGIEEAGVEAHGFTRQRNRMPASNHLQRGLSLIELMIAMVLGLIVIAALLNVYTGSSRSAQFTRGLQTMQENGRYGVSVLQRGIRLAGYSPAGDVSAFDIAAGDDTTIVVRVRQAYDCNGGDTTATGGLAVNTYRLDASAQQLTCLGNSATATAMPIVEGVEAFRVLYGVDTDGDEDTLEPQRFIPYDASIDPKEIAALRFALLVNSGAPIRTRARAEAHVLLDTVVDTNDRVARDVFTSTVLLRNGRL